MSHVVKIGKMYRHQLLAGDAVSLVAQPIAKGFDRVARKLGFHSNVSGCAGCRRRQAKLNAKLGNLNPFAK